MTSPTPSASYLQRTEWNVRDSDGTVIFTLAAALSGGSRRTAQFADKHGKPWIHLSARGGSYEPRAYTLGMGVPEGAEGLVSWPRWLLFTRDSLTEGGQGFDRGGGLGSGLGKFGGLGGPCPVEPLHHPQSRFPSGFLMPVEPCANRRLRNAKVGGQRVDSAPPGLGEGVQVGKQNGQEGSQYLK